jgi:hypothetical protein
MGAQAYSSSQQEKAMNEAQTAAERQRLAAMEQAKTAADRERQRLSQEGHFMSRENKARLAQMQKDAIQNTGEKLAPSLEAGVIAAMKGQLSQKGDQFETVTKDKEFGLKTGYQAISDSRRTFEAQRDAHRGSLLVDLLSTGSKSNLGAAFSQQSLSSTDPASWKTTVRKNYA